MTGFFISGVQASTDAEQYDIFFDISGEGFFGLLNDGPSGFTEMVEDIEDLGYDINDNFMTNSNLGFISKNTLRKADIFIVINPKRDFADDEKVALYDFVEDGGNLIVICDSLSSINTTNQLLEHFGIAFRKEIILNPEINFNGSNMTFNYAVPFSDNSSHLSQTDSEELFHINCSQQSNRNTKAVHENNTIMLTKGWSEGKITFLGTKEFLKNERYQQNKELWHYTLNVLTKSFDPSYIVFDPFEIQIPINDPEFFNTTFFIDYQVSSLNEFTGKEELIKKVNLSFEVNSLPDFGSSRKATIGNISEDIYERS